MEPSRQPSQSMIGVLGISRQIPSSAAMAVNPTSSPSPAALHPPLPQIHHHHHQQLKAFWSDQMEEIEQTSDFKNHTLPLARIKKIMKADEDVRMISSEAPIVFSKACEMFILELTLRAWIHTEENKRRTLQKNDIAAAISRTDVFDFLVDIVPRDEVKDDSLTMARAAMSGVDTGPYYYVPAQPQMGMGSSGMMAGKTAGQAGAMYVTAGNQSRDSRAYMWTPQPQMPSEEEQQ